MITKYRYIDLPADTPQVGDLLAGSRNGGLSFKFTLTDLKGLLLDGYISVPAGGSPGQVLGIVGSLPAWVTAKPIKLTTSFVYNVDKTLHSITTAIGTKTFVYNPDGTIAQIVGTGEYQTQTFTYSPDPDTGEPVLASITVS